MFSFNLNQFADSGSGGGKEADYEIPEHFIVILQTVAAIVPKDIKLTSFSVLMAKYKGLLDAAAPGAAAIEQLRDGDTVLIAEGCTHHRQCDDIGTVKIPRWLRKYTGKDIRIESNLSDAGFKTL